MKNPTENTTLANKGRNKATSGVPSMRMGTLVWGLVVVVLGVLLIAIRQAGLDLDAGQTAIWLLLGTGLAMVISGVVHLLRRQ